MNTSTTTHQSRPLRDGALILLACGTLAILSQPVHADAADVPEITISAPSVKIVGRDADLTPIEQTTITAHVSFDPIGLTTNSGVALLKDRVIKAARQACNAADPTEPDDGTCALEAVKAAQPQIEAAIARARSNNPKG